LEICGEGAKRKRTVSPVGALKAPDKTDCRVL